MRIVHVLSSYGLGGQERVALDLAAGQRALGHEVAALALAPGPLDAEFVARGVRATVEEKRAGFDLTLFGRLTKSFRRARVDIVHTHNPQPLIYAAPAARLAGARAVHTKHGANPDAGRRLWLRRTAARFTGAYVAVSETTAEVARANREVPERKLRTVPNGIDLARFHPDAEARREIRRELGIADDARVLGTVGRLAKEKDQALLIRAIAPLLDENRRLVIVGDGPEMATLRALATPFVHLTGARQDVPRLLASFDAFVLSSRTEGLPLVIPEAMASGLPVISTAVGGIPTVIDEGATGFLVAAGDGAALAAAWQRLASDGKLAEDFGRKGRAVALERYSADRMVRDYLNIYEEVRRE
jgi:glycosyltransferase involved in cell wall biosynthesis